MRKERVFIPGHLCAGLPQLHRCHEQCKQPFKVFEISQLCLFVCLSHLGGLVNCHAPDLCVVFHLVLQLEVRRPPETTRECQGTTYNRVKSMRSNLQRDPASSPAKRLPSLKRSFLTVTGPVGPLSSPPPIPPPTPSPTGPWRSSSTSLSLSL